MVKHRRWDTWVGVSNLLDLIWQPKYHFSKELGVGFKHISSMSLMAGATQTFHINSPYAKCFTDKDVFFYVMPYLDILPQEKRAHVWRRRGGVWAEELASGHRLFFPLLALPELQERLEHMETVVNGTQAEQGSRCGIGNQRGRLEDRKRKIV